MRKSRFSEEQIIGVLKEHQAGLPVAELWRCVGVDAALRPPERIGALVPRLVARQPDVAEQAVVQLSESAPLPAPLHPEPDHAAGRAAEAG
jgi:hypothetical protein